MTNKECDELKFSLILSQNVDRLMEGMVDRFDALEFRLQNLKRNKNL